MRVKVVKESVIYKKDIYRFGDEFNCSTTAGESLIKRGYVSKVSDEPVIEEGTPGRIELTDSANGKEHELFVKNGQLFMEESED